MPASAPPWGGGRVGGGQFALALVPPAGAGRLRLLMVAALGGVNLILNAWLFWKLWRAARDGCLHHPHGAGEDAPREGALLRHRHGGLLRQCGVRGRGGGAGGGTHRRPVHRRGHGPAFRLHVAPGPALLLDRTLEEAQQQRINRALAAHFDAYDSFIGVRSRLAATRRMCRWNWALRGAGRWATCRRVTDRVQAEIVSLLQGAVVTIIPRAV